MKENNELTPILTVSKEQLDYILDAEILDINGTKYIRKDMAFRVLEKWIEDKHKPEVLELRKAIQKMKEAVEFHSSGYAREVYMIAESILNPDTTKQQ